MSCEVIKAPAIEGLAKHLRSSHYLLQEPSKPILINGLSLTFPYKEFVEDSSFDFLFSSHHFAVAYWAMQKLFANPPSHWINYLKEIDLLRKKRGCDGPINLVGGAFFTVTENPQRVREINLPQFPRDSKGQPVFSDEKVVRAVIDGVLNDNILKPKMTKILSIEIPDGSSDLLSFEPVIDFLKKISFQGIVLNLGCGYGKRMERWQKEFPQIVGIDRQIHPEFYEPWFNHENGNGFILADFAEGCPFADSSIGAILLENVVHHVTDDCLQRGLKEITRVLIPGGFLFVGPQKEDYNTKTKKGDGYWRCFIKTQDRAGQWYLVRKKINTSSDTVSEDKPGPKIEEVLEQIEVLKQIFRDSQKKIENKGEIL